MEAVFLLMTEHIHANQQTRKCLKFILYRINLSVCSWSACYVLLDNTAAELEAPIQQPNKRRSNQKSPWQGIFSTCKTAEACC